MKKTELVSAATHFIQKTVFKLRKASPALLVTAGSAGVFGCVVLACRQTLKINDILDDHRNKMDAIKSAQPGINPELEIAEDEYTPEDAKRDTIIVYTQTTVKLIKLYAPAVTLGIASISCIIGSHYILQKRNAAIAAAYAAVDRSFKDYRKRVVERFGERIDHELRHGIKAMEIEETVIDDATGETATTKKTVDIFDPNDPNTYSEYARFFDEGSSAWEKDAEYNLSFLRTQQAFANDKLRAKGYLYLNEVYRMLGIPETKAGQVVGWIYDKKHPIGDNYVDFGIYDICRPKARDFVNGYERVILLDFNVDGNIWELMT